MHRFHASKHVRLLFHSFQRGLPHLLPGQHWYVGASLINALGSGLYYPFAVLYGHQVVGLSFPLVGLGLSVATGVSLATVPLQGSLVDRFGARTLLIAAHLVRAVEFQRLHGDEPAEGTQLYEYLLGFYPTHERAPEIPEQKIDNDQQPPTGSE